MLLVFRKLLSLILAVPERKMFLLVHQHSEDLDPWMIPDSSEPSLLPCRILKTPQEALVVRLVPTLLLDHAFLLHLELHVVLLGLGCPLLRRFRQYLAVPACPEFQASHSCPALLLVLALLQVPLALVVLASQLGLCDPWSPWIHEVLALQRCLEGRVVLVSQ